MRAVAAQLSSYSSRLDELAAGLPQLLPIGAFMGPGRASHDGDFQQASSRASAAAHTLALEARLLAAESTALEQRQRDWDRAKKAEDDRRRQAEQVARHRAARDHP